MLKGVSYFLHRKYFEGKSDSCLCAYFSGNLQEKNVSSHVSTRSFVLCKCQILRSR